LVNLKTDNTELFEYTKKVVEKNNLECVFATHDLYSGNFDTEIITPHKKSPIGEIKTIKSLPDDILAIKTHYEKIFLDEGLKINFLSFKLEKEKIIEDDSRKANRE